MLWCWSAQFVPYNHCPKVDFNRKWQIPYLVEECVSNRVKNWCGVFFFWFFFSFVKSSLLSNLFLHCACLTLFFPEKVLLLIFDIVKFPISYVQNCWWSCIILMLPYSPLLQIWPNPFCRCRNYCFLLLQKCFYW